MIYEAQAAFLQPGKQVAYRLKRTHCCFAALKIHGRPFSNCVTHFQGLSIHAYFCKTGQ